MGGSLAGIFRNNGPYKGAVSLTHGHPTVGRQRPLWVVPGISCPGFWTLERVRQSLILTWARTLRMCFASGMYLVLRQSFRRNPREDVNPEQRPLPGVPTSSFLMEPLT